MTNKIEFLTDEVIFSLSGSNVLTTWKDTNLRVDKQLKTITGGPLDGQIFGSCFQGQCNCGRKRSSKGGACPHCGAKILPPEKAWTAYARIDLPLFFCNRIKRENLIKYLYDSFNFKITIGSGQQGGPTKLKDVIEWAQMGYDEESQTITVTDRITDHTMCSYDGLLKVIAQYFPEKLGTYKSYINSSILVSPLIMRSPRYVIEAGEKVLKNNKLTIAYMCILYAIYYELPEAFEREYTTEQARAGYMAALRTYIVDVLEIVNEILRPNKESLPRTMQSHRLKNSGRCTIIPSPELKIDEVEIPRHLMYECCRDEFIQYMMQLNEWSYERATRQYLSQALSPDTQKMFTEYIEKGLNGKGKYVVINRNPTLYELGMMVCKVRLTNDYTIGIPLALCSPFGGDFDGDTFSFYSIPAHLTDLMVERMSPRNLFRYKKNQQALFTPSHEVMGGLIVGTRVRYEDTTLSFDSIDECKAYKKQNRDFKYQTHCIIAGKETTYARAYLSDLFNVDLDEYINSKTEHKEGITAKDIPFLYNNLSDLDDRVDRIQQIQEFALMITTMSGATTPSLEEMHADLPKEYLDQIRKVEKSDLTDQEKAVKVTLIYEAFQKEMNATETDEAGNTHYKYIDDSLVRKVSDSARAKVNQLLLILNPMFTTGPDKKIAVGETAMIDGMSPTDYVNMAIENRVTQDIKVSATPRSGFTTRQLEYLGNPYRYEDSEEGDSNEGVYIPLKDATGRTKTDGTVLTLKDTKSAGKDELVKVRSVVTSPRLREECKVCSDCISRINKWNDNDAVGVSLLTSLTEGLTQSGLSLKHGGHLFELDKNSRITAPEDGTLEIGETDITFRGKSGKVYVYPKTENLVRNYQPNNYYKKGEIMAVVYRLVTPSYRLDSIIEFIDAQRIHSNKTAINNKVLVTDCYAFTDGEIHYERAWNGSIASIRIGNMPYQFNPAACYFLPEGTKVKKGQRICNGTMDLQSAIAHLHDYVEIFYLFFKQFNELIEGMTPELIEFMYALIVHRTQNRISTSSVQKEIKESKGSLNKLAFRDPRGFFKTITHQGTEFIPDAVSELVLPSLILNDYDL